MHHALPPQHLAKERAADATALLVWLHEKVKHTQAARLPQRACTHDPPRACAATRITEGFDKCVGIREPCALARRRHGQEERAGADLEESQRTGRRL